ncbi:ankyrin repeat domain-containing protein [Sphingomonas sp. MG17]|uniref:Ankyrin repeat domain-containing protein n=1 Tax=Sphingomonas tagetis TaxID=2949092 RepID=A0A9X2HI28_9SPHN|nr:ankyrin repeat domain-containing protein [Sphingomonas tagetis]MCP3731581.1 ankyrin repeat domain-containing protein [Sphingomonas tagetis]
MAFRSSRPVLAAALIALTLPMSLPAAAQQRSDSYTFLEAVRKQDGNKVTEMLNEPGQTIVNVKDDRGDAAIHIVIKRRDSLYLRFILGRGGNINLEDASGNSPLMLAVEAAWPEGVALLIQLRANVNQANRGGETPLMRAVQRRDVDLVRTLLAANADPDQTDRLAGMTARDYAARDTRSPVIGKLLKDAPKVQRKGTSAGPKL